MKIQFDTFSNQNQLNFKKVNMPPRQKMIEYLGDISSADVYEKAKPELEKLSKICRVDFDFKIPENEIFQDIETRALDLFVKGKQIYYGYSPYNHAHEPLFRDNYPEMLTEILKSNIRLALRKALNF